MSFSENAKLEKQAFKPHLKYDIGTVVYLNSDIEKKTPLLIVGFDTDEDLCSDYFCNWMNAQGKLENASFP
jgi:hypothetical protein